jgi:hypothetical protein
MFMPISERTSGSPGMKKNYGAQDCGQAQGTDPSRFQPRRLAADAALVFPETLKPIRRECSVTHLRGNRAMPEIMLDGSRILAVVGELVPQPWHSLCECTRKLNRAASPALAIIR